MNLMKWTAATALTLGLVGCAGGIKKADIPATANPTDEITRLDGEVSKGYENHFDVLANDEFMKGQKYIKEAKNDVADGDKHSRILDDVAMAQAWMNKASEKSATRAAKIPGLIEARQKAITAGAREFPPTRRDLAKLDEQIRDDADRLDKMTAGDFADLQSKYFDLELSAIKNTQLGKSQAAIESAKDKNGEKYVPQALKRAELDYRNAANLITANRNGTDSYKEAVAKANGSAELLTLILGATDKGRLDESTATKMVMQDRKIENLEGKLDVAGDQAQQMGATIANQGQKLQKAATIMSLQQSLETARKEFSKDEAEVFQQGDKLLIRLKSMNFPSGRSDLPADALPVLAKVKSVAEDLGPQKVLVEGHTDSTGGAKVNNSLSEARASAISKYLETNGIAEDKLQSVGYGFQKPIASNKSKAGRAQNRRVDILITPVKPSTEGAQQPAKSM